MDRGDSGILAVSRPSTSTGTVGNVRRRKAVLYLGKNGNVPACPAPTGLDVMSAAHTIVVSDGPSHAGTSQVSCPSCGPQPIVVADGAAAPSC
jgi:hypothetical protein